MAVIPATSPVATYGQAVCGCLVKLCLTLKNGDTIKVVFARIIGEKIELQMPILQNKAVGIIGELIV